MSKSKVDKAKVNSYNKTIRNKSVSDDVRAKAYRMKAKEFEKDKIEDMKASIKKNILVWYNKAIELDPDSRAMYLADRCKFYQRLNKLENAKDDLSELENISQRELDKVAGKYVKLTVDSVKKLQDSETKLNSAYKNGDITKEQFESQLIHLEVTNDLVLRMGNHDEMLEEINNKTKLLEEEIEKLKLQNISTNKILDVHTYKILSNEKAIEQYNKKIMVLISKIVQVEQGVQSNREDIAKNKEVTTEIAKVLEETGIYDQMQIKNSISSLHNHCNRFSVEVNQLVNDSLTSYAQTFYCTLSNNILAYRMLSTGKIDGQIWENTHAEKYESVTSGVFKLASLACTAVPMWGETAAAFVESAELANEMIVKVMQLYTEAKNKRFIDLVNYELSIGGELDFRGDQLLNQGVLSAAVKIAEMKAEFIQGAIVRDPVKPIGNLIADIGGIANSFISKVIDPIMDTFFDVRKVRLSEIQKLAMADSALFLGWITSQRTGKHESEAFMKGAETPLMVGEKIANLYRKDGEIEKMEDSISIISDISAYIRAIKECAKGLKETGSETKDVGTNLFSVFKEIKKHGGQEIKDSITGTVKEHKVTKKIVGTKLVKLLQRKTKTDIEVYEVSETIYENHLLNYPEMMYSLLNLYSLNEIIDLSAKLDESLLLDSISTHDPELLHAGMMSVG